MRTETRIAATERLRREGRWSEASSFRDEERQRLRRAGSPRPDAVDAAWEAMIAQFPPLPSPPPQSEADAINGDVIALLARRSAETRPNPIRDTLWVYDNLDNHTATITDAPVLGAWSMLKWARDNRDRFFEHTFPKAIACRAKAEEARSSESRTVIQVEEIERMLNEIDRQS